MLCNGDVSPALHALSLEGYPSGDGVGLGGGGGNIIIGTTIKKTSGFSDEDYEQVNISGVCEGYIRGS